MKRVIQIEMEAHSMHEGAFQRELSQVLDRNVAVLQHAVHNMNRKEVACDNKTTGTEVANVTATIRIVE